MSKDEIFKDKKINRDFEFNDKVAAVFDDMLERSVPFYHEIIDMIASVLKRFLKPGDVVYDFGSSTGTTLIEIARRLKDQDLKYAGIDNSESMVYKAREKAEMYSKTDIIQFHLDDIMNVEIENAGAIILNYTMQFLRPLAREGFLEKIRSFLKEDGILIVSEKIISHDPVISRCYIDYYHELKKSKGYSELEIARKREALENVLIPFSSKENLEMLKNAGFRQTEQFFQWFNFASFLAIK